MQTFDTVLVTGCAGFIGSNFIKQFIKEFPQVQIIGIDDLSTGKKETVNKSIIFYEGSILDEELLVDLFVRHKPQYVFHFAAAFPRVSFSVEHPRYTSEVNILGTIALLEASKEYGVRRFIFSSSSSIYGSAKNLPTKEVENQPDPQSPYAVQKHASEQFCKVFSQLYGLDTICLRYFNVFGPGERGFSSYSTVISAWLEAAFFKGEQKGFIEGDGTQSRDFCYVDNVVNANILAMKNRRTFMGECINIASGYSVTLNAIEQYIVANTGIKLDLERRPSRLGDVYHTHADISKAQDLIGYFPKVSFEDGLKNTIAWFESLT